MPVCNHPPEVCNGNVLTFLECAIKAFMKQWFDLACLQTSHPQKSYCMRPSVSYFLSLASCLQNSAYVCRVVHSIYCCNYFWPHHDLYMHMGIDMWVVFSLVTMPWYSSTYLHVILQVYSLERMPDRSMILLVYWLTPICFPT